MIDLAVVKNNFKNLTVFRALLEDKVLTSLFDYLEGQAESDYCEFVSRLYRANGGNLTEYIKQALADSENPYVCILGKGEQAPSYIKAAAENELAVLNGIAQLAPSDLTDNAELPRYAVESADICAEYMKRAENIAHFGYGIYASNRMFTVGDCAELIPVKNADKTELYELACYEEQRSTVLRNTEALLLGSPAANILLTGDAGTGKSSTVKAVCNACFDKGLRLIELRKDQLNLIPEILDRLADNPLKFILFIDDLSFLTDDDCFNGLKAVLEGSVSARPRNVVVYATSNHRHIVRESFVDRQGDDVHINETMQEIISLSDRFGIHITFDRPSKATYLDIVKRLLCQNGIALSDAQIEAEAERFALKRGGRSPRLAKQFVDSVITKAQLN